MPSQILQYQPTQINPITDTKFRLIIPDLPNTQYFCQSFNIPSIEIPLVSQSSPTLTIPRPGTSLKFNQLTVEFLIDQDFNNFFELFNWMKQIAEPQGGTLNHYPKKDKNVFKDITVQILDNKNNPNFNFIFYNAFPLKMSDITLETKSISTKYLVCSVTFAFLLFDKE